MKARVTLMTGFVTTVLFAVVGVAWLIEGQGVLGGVVTGLAIFRGLWWVRQVAAVRAREREDKADQPSR